jgi:hypothetical protein
LAINQIPGASSGPTAVEIAAQVAAPSAATIASTVAAPSSSTIATAVAAAVPSTAGITSIVQANAGSPFGGTITNLGYVTGNGSATYTFTGLSSYKYLKLNWTAIKTSEASALYIRFNSDSTNVYNAHILRRRSDQATPDLAQQQNYNRIDMEVVRSDFATQSGQIIINNSNSSAYKTYVTSSMFNNTALFIKLDTEGIWPSTAAISSISVTTPNGTFNNNISNGGFYLTGAN